MEILALPLRVGPDGRLARTDAVAALDSLLYAMASSPKASGTNMPWFGLKEVFEAANPEREDQHGVQEALNHALAQLGVTWATVKAVRTPRFGQEQAPGIRNFGITLDVAGRGVVHLSVRA